MSPGKSKTIKNGESWRA